MSRTTSSRVITAYAGLQMLEGAVPREAVLHGTFDATTQINQKIQREAH